MQSRHRGTPDVRRLRRWLAAGPRPAVSRSRISVLQENICDEQLVAFLCSPLTYTLFTSIAGGQRRWLHIRAEWLDLESFSTGDSGDFLRTLRIAKPSGWSLQQQLARPPMTLAEAQQLRRKFGDAVDRNRLQLAHQVDTTIDLVAIAIACQEV